MMTSIKYIPVFIWNQFANHCCLLLFFFFVLYFCRYVYIHLNWWYFYTMQWKTPHKRNKNSIRIFTNVIKIIVFSPAHKNAILCVVISNSDVIACSLADFVCVFSKHCLLWWIVVLISSYFVIFYILFILFVVKAVR